MIEILTLRVNGLTPPISGQVRTFGTLRTDPIQPGLTIDIVVDRQVDNTLPVLNLITSVASLALSIHFVITVTGIIHWQALSTLTQVEPGRTLQADLLVDRQKLSTVLVHIRQSLSDALSVLKFKSSVALSACSCVPVEVLARRVDLLTDPVQVEVCIRRALLTLSLLFVPFLTQSIFRVGQVDDLFFAASETVDLVAWVTLFAQPSNLIETFAAWIDHSAFPILSEK